MSAHNVGYVGGARCTAKLVPAAPHLVGVDERLAGLHVLAIIIVDDVKIAVWVAAGIGGAAPDHAGAALRQARVLAKGRLGA